MFSSTLVSGIGLFEGDFAPSNWRLVDQRTSDRGVVLLTYERQV